MAKRREAIIIAVIVVIVICVFTKAKLGHKFFFSSKLNKLVKEIDNDYIYETNELDGIEGIYDGYVASLENSATYYLDKEQLIAEKACAKGNYFGTGLTVTMTLDGQALVVTKVIPGSSADKAGVKLGDKIVQINDTMVLPSNEKPIIDELYDLTQRDNTYIFSEDGEKIEKHLTPGEVEIDDISAKMLDNILYIKINTIKNGTADKISALLEGASSGVILDIRDLITNNVEEVSKICDTFVNADKMFEVKKKDHVDVYKATEGAYSNKVVVITNAKTKQCAELIAYVLKANNATLVGSSTAGIIYTNKIIALEDATGMSVADGIICDKYGTEFSESGIEPQVRALTTEEERLQLVNNGYIDEDIDSFLEEAVKQFSNK